MEGLDELAPDLVKFLSVQLKDTRQTLQAAQDVRHLLRIYSSSFLKDVSTGEQNLTRKDIPA